MSEKRCVICGAEFEARGKAKTCSQAHSRELRAKNISVSLPRWRAANAERLKAKSHERYVENRARHLEKSHAYYRLNKAKVTATNLAWRAANAERYRQYKARWYQENKPAISVKTSAYRNANADQIRACRKAYQIANAERLRAEKRAEKREQSAAHKLVRELAAHGLDALTSDPRDMRKPKGDGRRNRPPRDKVRQRESNRRSAAKRQAALKLVREIQTKGLEALL